MPRGPARTGFALDDRWVRLTTCLGLPLFLSACTSKELNEIVGTLIAVFLIGVVALLVFAAVVGGCFLISLVLLILNFTAPSRLSVAGAGAFGLVFLGSGMVFGTVLLVQAAHEAHKADPIILGLLWMMSHVVYAAALIGSSVFGHLKRRRTAQGGRAG